MHNAACIKSSIAHYFLSLFFFLALGNIIGDHIMNHIFDTSMTTCTDTDQMSFRDVKCDSNSLPFSNFRLLCYFHIKFKFQVF